MEGGSRRSRGGKMSEMTVETMNGHTAQGFQWFGRRRAGV